MDPTNSSFEDNSRLKEKIIFSRGTIFGLFFLIFAIFSYLIPQQYTLSHWINANSGRTYPTLEKDNSNPSSQVLGEPLKPSKTK